MSKNVEITISVRDRAKAVISDVSKAFHNLWAAVKSGDLGQIYRGFTGLFAAGHVISSAIRGVISTIKGFAAAVNEYIAQVAEIERATNRLARVMGSKLSARREAKQLIELPIKVVFDESEIIAADAALRRKTKNALGGVEDISLLADVAVSTNTSLSELADTIGIIVGRLQAGDDSFGRFAMQLVSSGAVTADVVAEMERLVKSGKSAGDVVNYLFDALKRDHGGAFSDITDDIDSLARRLREQINDAKRELSSGLFPMLRDYGLAIEAAVMGWGVGLSRGFVWLTRTIAAQIAKATGDLERYKNLTTKPGVEEASSEEASSEETPLEEAAAPEAPAVPAAPKAPKAVAGTPPAGVPSTTETPPPSTTTPTKVSPVVARRTSSAAARKKAVNAAAKYAFDPQEIAAERKAMAEEDARAAELEEQARKLDEDAFLKTASPERRERFWGKKAQAAKEKRDDLSLSRLERAKASVEFQEAAESERTAREEVKAKLRADADAVIQKEKEDRERSKETAANLRQQEQKGLQSLHDKEADRSSKLTTQAREQAQFADKAVDAAETARARVLDPADARNADRAEARKKKEKARDDKHISNLLRSAKAAGYEVLQGPGGIFEAIKTGKGGPISKRLADAIVADAKAKFAEQQKAEAQRLDREAKEAAKRSVELLKLIEEHTKAGPVV
jgi:hypothetical protein